jgi:hypothetical protein
LVSSISGADFLSDESGMLDDGLIAPIGKHNYVEANDAENA